VQYSSHRSAKEEATVADNDELDQLGRRDDGKMVPVTIHISMGLMEEVNRITRAEGTNSGIVIYQLLKEWVRDHQKNELSG